MTANPSGSDRAAEVDDLRARLAEAEEALHAIRNGEVDGVLATGAHGEQVYTLSGVDRIYRQLIETMSEGAVTLSANGVILYGNVRVAAMLGRPLDQVLGSALQNYLSPADQQALDSIIAQACTAPIRQEITLKSSDDRQVPVYVSASCLRNEGSEAVFCLVLTDLTEQRTQERLKVQLEELQRWQDVMLDREDRVQELKREVNKLCRHADEAVRYPSQEGGSSDAASAEPKP